MTAVLKIFRRLLVESGAENLLDYGDVVNSQQDTACTGAPIQKREFSIAAGSSATLWDWTNDGDFTAMLIECDGFAWIAQKVDAPTSTTNHAAAGTAVNYPKEGISCFAPLILQGMIVPVAASSSNYAGSAFHSSVANGRRYSVTAKNPSDALAAIKVTAYIVL